MRFCGHIHTVGAFKNENQRTKIHRVIFLRTFDKFVHSPTAGISQDFPGFLRASLEEGKAYMMMGRVDFGTPRSGDDADRPKTSIGPAWESHLRPGLLDAGAESSWFFYLTLVWDMIRQGR